MNTTSNKLPLGKSMQTGDPWVWATDVFCLANAVFVKNVTVANFYKSSDFIPKLHISGCWKKSFKKPRDLAILGLCYRMGTSARG